MIQFYMRILSVSMRTVNALKRGQGLMFLYVVRRASTVLCTSQGPGRVCCDGDSGRNSSNLSSKVCLIALDKNRIPVFPVTQYEKTRVILVY